MKLYVNENRTKWAGTQADAKKELGQYEVWEVPTDKKGLLKFLNNFDNSPSSTADPYHEDYVAEQANKEFSILDKHTRDEQDYVSCELLFNRNDRHLTEGESGWDRPDKDDWSLADAKSRLTGADARGLIAYFTVPPAP